MKKLCKDCTGLSTDVQKTTHSTHSHHSKRIINYIKSLLLTYKAKSMQTDKQMFVDVLSLDPTENESSVMPAHSRTTKAAFRQNTATVALYECVPTIDCFKTLLP